MRHDSSRWLLIAVSILIALLMTVLPLNEYVAMFWPSWTTLILIYWALEAPEKIGMGVAFLSGLLLDILNGQLLGAHSLAEVITVFLALKFRNRARAHPLLQQSIFIFMLLFNERIIHMAVSVFSSIGMPDNSFWISPFTGIVIWPFLYILMDRIRYRKQ